MFDHCAFGVSGRTGGVDYVGKVGRGRGALRIFNGAGIYVAGIFVEPHDRPHQFTRHTRADNMHWDGPGIDAWHAWSPQQAAVQLAGCGAHWCVVGGWAIDLFLGRQTRKHDDLEIAIPRDDFARVRAALHGYQLHAVGSGEVHALADNEMPPQDKHQTWVLDPTTQQWRIDVMLEPGDAHTWVYRRDESIRMPRADIAGARDGVPYLTPPAALLVKAKSPRAKDEVDFSICAPALDDNARNWLRAALQRMHPQHPWIDRLG